MPKPRKNSSRALKPVLHIFCEGKKTEPNYIHGYLDQHHPGNRRLKIIKIEHCKKNTPPQLVDEASTLKLDKDTPQTDVFWVVYDRESETKYPDTLHQKAYDTAQAQGINLAISNVCFEFWLLLHFVETSACYNSCDDLLKRSELKSKLKENGVDNYDKADQRIFATVKNLVPLARERAKRVNANMRKASNNNKPFQLNPYTGMVELLDAIDEFVRESDV